MNEDKQKILDRVAKLMNLGKDQAGTPEGESALKMASVLMAKHRIKESEIDMSTDSLLEDFVEGYTDQGGWRQWVVDLSSAIANTFDCKFFYRATKYEDGQFTLTFIGTDSDVETSIYLTEVVMHHIETKAYDMWPAERNWRKRNEFGQAAVMVVSERLRSMKAEMTKVEEEVDCRDLVVQKKSKIEQAWKESGRELKNGRRKDQKLRDRKTWLAGMKAGETAPLNRGIAHKDDAGYIN